MKDIIKVNDVLMRTVPSTRLELFRFLLHQLIIRQPVLAVIVDKPERRTPASIKSRTVLIELEKGYGVYLGTPTNNPNRVNFAVERLAANKHAKGKMTYVRMHLIKMTRTDRPELNTFVVYDDKTQSNLAQFTLFGEDEQEYLKLKLADY